MKKLISFQLMLFFSIGFLPAQQMFGPKITAMGNNSSSVNDIWSIAANTSGMTSVQLPTLALNHAYYFSDKQLSRQAIAFVFPIKNTYLGLDFQRYGITEYNEIKAGFALAKKFGDELSIGIKVNYHQLKISNYGQTTGFSVDVGAMYKLSQEIVLGLYLNNPSKQRYNNSTIAIAIPVALHIGATYQAANKISIATTIRKSIHTAIDVAIGIDYQIISSLSLRGGLSMKPFKQYAGIGFNFKKFTIDGAIENDPYLGYSPQIALTYAF